MSDEEVLQERLRQRVSALSVLTDDHPLWRELDQMLRDGRDNMIDVLSNPKLDANERGFYSGVLHHVTEFHSSLDALRKLKTD